MATAVQQFSEAARAAGVRDFTAEWADTQRRLATISTGQRVAQFGYSSIEDDFVTVYDALGQARQRMGKQSDGTFGVLYANGDPPPKPSPPTVSARQLAVVIGWDGTFAGGLGRPGDFARVDVHMSTVSGFVPDGSTVVGSIPAEGVVSIPADNTTHYVRIVAVTTSDVISAPTDEIPVLALPAVEIAAGAVGADQLAATVALLSRLIVGDPLGARLEIEGRDGAIPGMRLYDVNGLQTFRLDATTGDVSIKGAIRTADTGERMILRESAYANDMRFYPSTGSAFAKIQSYTSVVGSAQYGSVFVTAPAYGARQSTMWCNYDTVYLGRNGVGNVQSGGQLYMTDTSADLSFSDYTCYVGVSAAGVLLSGGQATGLTVKTLSTGRPMLTSNTIALQFDLIDVDVYDPSSGAYRAITVSAVNSPSARKTKRNIQPAPFDSLRVIRNAPMSMFERSDEADDPARRNKGRKHFGPMADDLPAVLRVPTGLNKDIDGVDLGNQLGVAWDGIGRLADRLDTLEARLAALEKTA